MTVRRGRIVPRTTVFDERPSAVRSTQCDPVPTTFARGKSQYAAYLAPSGRSPMSVYSHMSCEIGCFLKPINHGCSRMY